MQEFTIKMFHSNLVPFFEKIRDEIATLLREEAPTVSKLFSEINLVMIDNSEIEPSKGTPYYVLFSNHTDTHLFQKNKLINKHDYCAYSTSSFSTTYTKFSFIDSLRRYLIQQVLKLSTPNQIFEFFNYFFGMMYKEIDISNGEKFIKLELFNWEFDRGVFAITPYRINLIFPLSNKLDSDEIEDDTAGNMKIVITNKEEEEANNCYKGFDNIISFFDLTAYLDSTLEYTANFIKSVLSISDKTVLSLFDLLKTSESTDIHELKKAIVNTPYSKGAEFEKVVERFLELCFMNSYSQLQLRKQIPNKNGIRRRDFIIDNSGSSNLFLKKLEAKGAEFLLFDAKNYKDPLSLSDLDTFTNYIRENEYFGKIGIIISREGVKQNCEDYLVSLLGQHKIKIIILNQEDILEMLDHINYGKDPIDIIESKYKNLLLQL